MKQTNKAFSLVELLVVIAIIGLLSTIVIVSFTGIRQSAISAKGKSNQHTANVYCTMYPGQSTLNGDVVYCDNNSVMWSPTLTEGGAAKTYAWATQLNGVERELPAYAKGDCNNLTDKDVVDYPACQICRNLNYAGFSEGWYLPSQRKGVLVENCNTVCGRNYAYCAPDRQLWDFGAENCSNWKPDVCVDDNAPVPAQGQCLPSYDNQAQAGRYWSSMQGSATTAWDVNFNSAGTDRNGKSNPYYVRCALGNYNK